MSELNAILHVHSSVRSPRKKLRSRWRMFEDLQAHKCRGKGHKWEYRVWPWFGLREAVCMRCGSEARPKRDIEALRERSRRRAA